MSTTYIHLREDSKKFPTMCDTYDYEDTGYTSGCKEVFIERLEEWRKEAIEDGSIDRELSLSHEILELEKCEERIEVIN